MFRLSDTANLEISFVEKRNRDTQEWSCFLEVTVDPNLSCPCQMICPLGNNWENVKKRYPEFIDIIKEIHGYHEICREIHQIRIISVVGDKGLYDLDINEWNTKILNNG